MNNNLQSQDSDAWVMSYLNLRMLIGILGTILPILLILRSWYGYTEWRTSISAYYYTNSRDFFVGILVAIGVFLITYYGHNRRDSGVSSLAGIAALGVAFFPTNDEGQINGIINFIHHISAITLFGSLTYMCWLFITSDKDKNEDKEKQRQREGVYTICAFVMGACILYLLGHYLVKHVLDISDLPAIMVLIVESIAIVTFGVSWWVKGRSFERLLNLFGN